MSFISDRYTQLRLFYFLFISYLLVLLINQILHGYTKESWQITEFLINFQGGFVRRGLLGELIHIAYTKAGINPYLLIISLSLSAYILLIWIFFKYSKQYGSVFLLLPFVFLLGGPIINNYWVRKDILILLVFFFVTKLSFNKSSNSILLLNLLLIIGLLIHETLGFFCFPILALTLLSFNIKSDTKKITPGSVILTLVQLFPSFVIFILCIYYNGGSTVASLIWKSWESVDFPFNAFAENQIPAAIDGLSRSLPQQLGMMINGVRNTSNGFSTVIMWGFLLMFIYAILININKLSPGLFNKSGTKKIDRNDFSNILTLQILGIFPLFILGSDYGRWVFLWVVSSFLIVFIIPHNSIVTIIPKQIASLSSRLTIVVDSVFEGSRKQLILILLFLGVPFSSHGLSTYFESTPIVSVINFLLKIVYQIALFIKDLII